MFLNHPAWWTLLCIVTGLSFVFGYVGYPNARTSQARARTRHAMSFAAGGFLMVGLADAPGLVLVPLSILFMLGMNAMLRYLEGPERS